ncbi:hypothetical protein B0H16DRAFT_1601423 [Mycena metata]|uniref:F-box domain-containing protein n=1 Tax=Mycena metata TaxID=1033252 RepID=A0AAD7MKN8_9AGAR|nr:hypothetical protein B0H16DRAFT_1601423 [Mycena metata]
MRRLNSLPLDDDIVDQIFTFCPDFTTLNSLNLVCKDLYGVFLAHPKSINAAVARNLTGPESFPEALRYLRYNFDQDDDDSNDVVPIETSPLTALEKIQLGKNADVVRKLEDLFSQWYKDGKSTTSVLTPEESFRFRRAMYRILIYSSRFGALEYDEDEAIEISDEPPTMAKIFTQRHRMLSKYPTPHLREIHTVVKFLKQAADWVRPEIETQHDDPEQTTDICVAAGPALILAAYEARGMEVMEDACEMVDSFADIPFFAGFFSNPLSRIWTARGVPAPPEGAQHLGSILEVVPDGLDTCRGCTASPVSRLWTSTTWYHFIVDTPTLLPGKLHLNRTETDVLHALLHHPHDPHTPTTDVLVREIFRDVPLRPEFTGWTAEDRLCGDCLRRLLDEHTWMWLRDRRVADGWVPPEDCWYGYDCTTQYKNAHHATTKNHLCEPTK